MSQKKMDDYIQEGIYGPKEIRPDERRKFLGTIRERVVLVLTQAEVRGEKGIKELTEAMKQYPSSKMLLNGDMNFRFFKPYREVANQHKISYTSITDKASTSNYGLVLTMPDAIDKEEIFLPEEKEVPQEEETKKTSWWKKLFETD
jgi:uncharacterized protein YueI